MTAAFSLLCLSSVFSTFNSTPARVSGGEANLSVTPGGHSDCDLHQINNLKCHFKAFG